MPRFIGRVAKSSAAGAARYSVSRVKLSGLAAHFAVAGRGAADRQQKLADCVTAAIHEARQPAEDFDALKGGVPLAEWLAPSLSRKPIAADGLVARLCCPWTPYGIHLQTL